MFTKPEKLRIQRKTDFPKKNSKTKSKNGETRRYASGNAGTFQLK